MLREAPANEAYEDAVSWRCDRGQHEKCSGLIRQSNRYGGILRLCGCDCGCQSRASE